MIKKFNSYNENVFKPKKVKEREQEIVTKGLFTHRYVSKCKVIFEKKWVHGMLENDGDATIANVKCIPQVHHNPLRLYIDCIFSELQEKIHYREAHVYCEAYLENYKVTKVDVSWENLIFPSETIAKEMLQHIISSCLYHIEELKNTTVEERREIIALAESEAIKAVAAMKASEKIC